ncbi:MAG TPA: HAD hydrolase-like protein, partial [Candidatus Dorea intestinavium]|nr:HAD hydrolase-like protein [Candidatus Dorea intestinavium]
EGLYKALEVLNVDKKNSIYIGDSEVDVATGLNAGIKTIAVAWGFRTEKELIEAGAKTIVHLPGELYQEIKK